MILCQLRHSFLHGIHPCSFHLGNNNNNNNNSNAYYFHTLLYKIMVSLCNTSSTQTQESLSNILSEPDPSPMESMSQLFILMPHLRTFFMNNLPLLNSSINRYK